MPGGQRTGKQELILRSMTLCHEKTSMPQTHSFKIVKQAYPEPDASKNEAAFNQLVSELPADDHRFVVFDFTDKKDDGREIAKLVLIKW